MISPARGEVSARNETSSRDAPSTPAASVGVVIPAAGVGARMGGRKKPFLELDGTPLLELAMRPFLARDDVISVVVALTPEDVHDLPDWLDADPRVTVVEGGDTRTASVRRALAALPPDASVVLIHDGARPLLTPDVISRCVLEAIHGRGAVAGCPATDTLKRVDRRNRIVSTPDRRELWHAQTPQAFPRTMIDAAYATENETSDATDDASLAEAQGFEVVMVEADRWNLKVTRPDDLEVARLLLGSRSP